MMRFALLIVGILTSVLGPAGSARAHAELDRAEPRVGATVASAPKEVVLQFSEELVEDKSFAEVRDVTGVRMDVEGLKARGDDKAVAVLKLKPLTPGEYHVVWRAATDDGVVTLGRFYFIVQPSH